MIDEALLPDIEGENSPVRNEIIGNCPGISTVWQSINTYAPTELPILIQGETGTGKELFARAIHEASNRRNGPFIPIDCVGFSENLIESELFGYEKGAFTGAYKDKAGMMEWAQGGTLFLDEIGEMHISLQVKLLRVLETGKVTPLGAREPSSTDLNIRIISATNRELSRAIEEGKFREDLFYRLAGATIELPPLRARSEDLDLLVRNFIVQHCKLLGKSELDISPETLDLLRMYRWPGNVRELRHVIGVAAAAADGVIHPQHLPPSVRLAHSGFGSDAISSIHRIRVLAELECDLGSPIDLKKVKAQVAHQAEMQVISAARILRKGKKSDLARFLNVDPKTLREKLRELDT